MGERAWSAQQRAVFDWFRQGEGNLVVRARAGTGKTTTIIEAIGHAPEARILLCAFNKKIATELGSRLANPNAEAATLHGVGFAAVRRYMTGVKVDGSTKRADALAVEACRECDGESPPSTGALRLVARLCTLAREAAPFATVEDLLRLADAHEIEPDDDDIADGFDAVWIAERALVAMVIARDERPPGGVIDYADMLYLPVVKGWAKPRYDLVVVDEAQDMNACQLLLALRVAKGRVAVIGDDRQAIYSFRGADAGSLDRLKAELRATELGLTTTYRCARAVVALAASLVPDFTAGPANPEGLVETLGYDQALAQAAPGDFWLSRKNAPLAAGALALLRQGRRARIEGRDLAGNLIALAKTLATGKAADSVPQFLARLTAWATKEATRAKAAARGDDEAAVARVEAKIAAIEDKAATLRVVAEGASSVREMTSRIEQLFADDGRPSVVFSSIHRSKGLEASRVFVLVDSFGKRDVGVEADNLKYVAWTRAKTTLTLVTGMPAGT